MPPSEKQLENALDALAGIERCSVCERPMERRPVLEAEGSDGRRICPRCLARGVSKAVGQGEGLGLMVIGVAQELLGDREGAIRSLVEGVTELARSGRQQLALERETRKRQKPKRRRRRRRPDETAKAPIRRRRRRRPQRNTRRRRS